MPVRAIKRISGKELTIEIPSAVLNAFAITYNGIGSSRGKFVCEFKNHFERSKEPIGSCLSSFTIWLTEALQN